MGKDLCDRRPEWWQQRLGGWEEGEPDSQNQEWDTGRDDYLGGGARHPRPVT